MAGDARDRQGPDGPLDRVLGEPLSLLEHWMPADPGTGLPTRGGTTTVVDYDAEYDRQPWPAAPTPADASRYGDFTGENQRFPVAVDVLNRHVPDGPRRGRGSRPGDEVAAEVARLLSARLNPDAPDPRVRLLTNHLAGELSRWCPDVLHIAVAAEPGGAPIDEEVHLVVRGVTGEVLHLSLRPAAPANVRASRLASYLEHFPRDETPALTFAVRTTALAAILGDLLPIECFAQVDPHGLRLDPADLDAADGAVRAWLPTVQEWTESFDWSWWRRAAGRRPIRLTVDGLRQAQADLEHQFLLMATHAWAGDDSAEGPPRDPALLPYLARDLVDCVLAGTTNPRQPEPLLAYTAGLPLTDAPDGAAGWLVLIGPTRAGVLACRRLGIDD